MDLYWQFTDAAIDATPAQGGVYAFFNEAGEALLIGSTTKSLKAILEDHWRGREGALTCGAAFVGLEFRSNPLEREAELAKLHVQLFGRIPRRHAS